MLIKLYKNYNWPLLKIRLLLFAIFIFPAIGYSKDCQLTASVCIDTTPYKLISGVKITLDQVGGCWDYQDTYECIKPSAVDYCSAISTIPGCSQTDTQITYAKDGTTILYETRTYRCSDESMATPTNTIKLDSTYTIVTDTLNTTQCDSVSSNPSCKLASHICTEGPATKVINGLSVYKDCWNWNDSYSCVAQSVKDYCTALRSTSGCSEITPAVCNEKAWDGSCMSYTRKFYCGDGAIPKDTSDTILVDTSYTIKKDAIDTSQCSTPDNAANCAKASETCTEGPETRNINGLNIYKDCWKWQVDYTCTSNSIQSDCAALKNKGCSFESESCIGDPIKGVCLHKAKVYNCMSTPGSSNTVLDCSGQMFCVDGQCDNFGYTPDKDFAMTAALSEGLREAGTYLDPNTLKIFNGISEGCTKGYGGLKNCCAGSSGAGASNYAVIQGVLQGATVAGAQTLNVGSRWMFDFMYPDMSTWTNSAIKAMQNDFAMIGSNNSFLFTPTNFNPSLSIYGFTASFGGTSTSSAVTEFISKKISTDLGSAISNISETISSSTTTLIGPDGTGAALGELGNFQLDFNPYMFAANVAIQVVMEALSCTQQEQSLQMHKGTKLTHFIGTYCSKELELLFGTLCLETTDRYCSFNSKLSKILNEQGRPQLGKGWGTPEQPNCAGFTVTEFQSLDFSQIDLSEFIDDIMANAKIPDQKTFSGNVQKTLDRYKNNYYAN